ncbi:hypothetical protein FQA39_LY12385 [Lamprigera yunnana]|nr:hypothetical protein FQA39_LY12385 [Lamprigera yunnana]
MDNSEISLKNNQINDNVKYSFKLYKERWVMLFLLFITSCVSLIQWIQYSIISDVVVKYYNVSYEAANWTTTIYLLLYIPFVFLGNYVIEKYGLRIAVILSALGSCVGAWIKIFSVNPHRFWVLLLGQSVVGISQVFLLPSPPLLASEWFGADEVSMASSIGVSGCQLGAAIGFILAPILVKTQNNLYDTGIDLLNMAIATTISATFVFLLVLLFFKNEPPTPPSRAKMLCRSEKKLTVGSVHLKKLFTNRSYIALLISYGVDVGVYYAISTLLNQIIIQHMPDKSEDAGRIGLVLVIAGIIGSVGFGILLDRFKLYKVTTLIVQLCSLIAVCLLSFSLTHGITSVYISAVLLGVFMTSIIPIGLEVGVELTYPEPEGTSSGLLNASAQIFGIFLTYLYSHLFYTLGVIYANAALAALFFVSFMILLCTPFVLQRQAVNTQKFSHEIGNPDTGLRIAVILGALGPCVGGWIKVLSVDPNRFWVLMLGQGVVGVSQVFVLPIPSLLAAEWFGANEVSTACSIGATGCQIGTVLGFVLALILVKSQKVLHDIDTDLLNLAIATAVFSTIIFLLILLFFKNEPQSPPSQANMLSRSKKISTVRSVNLKKFFTNRCFVALLISYGVDVGIYYAISTLLNQIILQHVLKSYPFLNFNLFMIGMIPIGFEIGVELTYPEPEGTSSGLLNASSQSLGILLTYLYSHLFYTLGIIYANAAMAALFLLSFIILLYTPFVLQRQAVDTKNSAHKIETADAVEL